MHNCKIGGSIHMPTSPFTGEIPSRYADRLGEEYAATVTSEEKKTKGQFFTPISIANFMASLANAKSREISILDPGCGTGILAI